MVNNATDVNDELTYDEFVKGFHDKLAARVEAVLERLRALEDELAEIQLDIEHGP